MSREASNVLTRMKHFAFSLRRLGEEVGEIRRSYADTGVKAEVLALGEDASIVQGDEIPTDATKKEVIDYEEVLRLFEVFMDTNGPAIRNILEGL